MLASSMIMRSANLTSESGFSVKAEDTTAAGDSFNAGFLSSLVAGDDIETAVRAGAALSAKVINHRGALVEI